MAKIGFLHYAHSTCEVWRILRQWHRVFWSISISVSGRREPSSCRVETIHSGTMQWTSLKLSSLSNKIQNVTSQHSYFHVLLTSNSAFCYPNLSASDFQTNETWKVNTQNFITKWKSTALKQSQYMVHLAVHRTSGSKGNKTNTEPVFPSLALWQRIYSSGFNVFHVTTLSG